GHMDADQQQVTGQQGDDQQSDHGSEFQIGRGDLIIATGRRRPLGKFLPTDQKIGGGGVSEKDPEPRC
ncbi:MAG: hypothetical protein AAGI15_18220, partial [Pseudomonadota bacterium]